MLAAVEVDDDDGDRRSWRRHPWWILPVMMLVTIPAMPPEARTNYYNQPGGRVA